MKKLHKEMEMQGRGYTKKLDDLQNATMKHMEQYDIPYGLLVLNLFTVTPFNHIISCLQNCKRFGGSRKASGNPWRWDSYHVLRSQKCHGDGSFVGSATERIEPQSWFNLWVYFSWLTQNTLIVYCCRWATYMFSHISDIAKR